MTANALPGHARAVWLMVAVTFMWSIAGVVTRCASTSWRPMTWLRIPLMADSDSIPIADSVPGDGGHVARVS